MSFLKENTFTVFDVETTGLNAEAGDKIIEIAALKIINGKIDEKDPFVTLVNPEQNIPAMSTEISGITNEMVKDAPIISDILGKFLEYIKDTIIIAHNAEFDMGFLKYAVSGCGMSSELPKHVCTMALSKNIFSFQTQHNLDILMQRMKVKAEGDRHRALTDVQATAEVFMKLCDLRPEVISEQLEGSR